MYGLSEAFFDAMSRRNQMRSWSASRTGNRHNNDDPVDKNTLFIDLDEKNLRKLLFLPLKRGPSGLRKFFEDNKAIIEGIDYLQLKNFLEIFHLDEAEKVKILNIFARGRSLQTLN